MEQDQVGRERRDHALDVSGFKEGFMSTYTKLARSIVMSSIWSCADRTRIVWITMLALKDPDQIVRAKLSGLARAANVPLDDASAAIETLTSPDPESPNQPEQGRRIKPLDDGSGWFIINGQKYDGIGLSESRREEGRIRAARYRERHATSQEVTQSNAASRKVTPNNAPSQEVTPSLRSDSGSDSGSVTPIPPEPSQAPRTPRLRQPSLVADAPGFSLEAWNGKTKGPHHEFIQAFSEAFQARFATPYAFAGGRDAKAVKGLLAIATQAEILETSRQAWARQGFPFGHATTLHGLLDGWNAIKAALAPPKTTGITPYEIERMRCEIQGMDPGPELDALRRRYEEAKKLCPVL